MRRALHILLLVIGLAGVAYFMWAGHRLRDMNTLIAPRAFPYPESWIPEFHEWCHALDPNPARLFCSLGPYWLVHETAQRLALLSGLIFFIGAAGLLLRRWKNPGGCPHCGYDLRGTFAAGRGECPECGRGVKMNPQALDPAIADCAARSHRRRSMLLRIFWVFTLLLILLPPWKQVDFFADSNRTQTRWVGHSPWRPEQIGGRGGPVSLFWSVLCLEITAAAAMLAGMDQLLRRMRQRPNADSPRQPPGFH